MNKAPTIAVAPFDLSCRASAPTIAAAALFDLSYKASGMGVRCFVEVIVVKFHHQPTPASFAVVLSPRHNSCPLV